jgi:2-polyprenyl-6-methoxyphenol hydroxylase-like FAD-dependent oxidoreductase
VSDVRRVLIAGGGVGGLTAAATFARRGVEVVLIERRSAFDIPGVGLGQPANALRVYDTLGVLDEVLATGFSYDQMCLFDASRRLIVEHKFLLGDHRVPAFCALSRLQLHDILLGAAERAGVQVVLGVMVNEIQEDKDRVDVQFSNGQRDSFDLLYRVPEILTLGRFPDARESDSRRRTEEVRHVGSDTVTPGF